MQVATKANNVYYLSSLLRETEDQIRIAGDLVNISDFYREVGKPDKKGVGNWFKLRNTRNLLATISHKLNKQPTQLTQTDMGKYGGVWVHWYMALQYGVYVGREAHSRMLSLLQNRLHISREQIDELSALSVEATAVRITIRENFRHSYKEFSHAIAASGADIFRPAAVITAIAVAGEKIAPDDMDTDSLLQRIELQSLISRKLASGKYRGNKEVVSAVAETAKNWLNFMYAETGELLPEDRLSKIKEKEQEYVLAS